MTHDAGGRRNRSSAGLSSGLSWQLTESDVISLAINVVQNGQNCQELRPDLAYLLGGSGMKPRGRGQSGDVPASDPIRAMLEEIHGKILRANRLQAARALARATDDGNRPPRGYNGG